MDIAKAVSMRYLHPSNSTLVNTWAKHTSSSSGNFFLWASKNLRLNSQCSSHSCSDLCFSTSQSSFILILTYVFCHVQDFLFTFFFFFPQRYLFLLRYTQPPSYPFLSCYTLLSTKAKIIDNILHCPSCLNNFCDHSTRLYFSLRNISDYSE